MSKMSNPFVSVIIPVYNDPGCLKTCLQALEEQTYPKSSYEVIIVDNGSDESIEPLVAEFNQAKASFETRRGSYAARNKGLSLARGEIIAFTDADCIPASDWIERGIANLLRIPNCGIVGGKVELFFKNLNRPTAAELYEKIITGYLDQKTLIEKESFSATANLFTFRYVFDNVGYFDNNLESGGDKEWGRRVSSFGYKLVYASDICVAHPARHSLAELVAKERRVAKGIAIVDSNWEIQLPPLTWSYKSIMEHLPPLPPVFRTMRLKRASFRTKMLIIILWFVIKYIRIEECARAKLGGKSAR